MLLLYRTLFKQSSNLSLVNNLPSRQLVSQEIANTGFAYDEVFSTLPALQVSRLSAVGALKEVPLGTHC